MINGSPRVGNTDYVMESVSRGLEAGNETVKLRDLDIRHCNGCLACEKDGKCPIDDGMQGLYEKMENADILVIGTPNYFDNVPGLLKDFIDRTNTFHNSTKLSGKKVVFIVVGGGSSGGDTGRVADQTLTYFANANKLEIAGKFIFTGTDKQPLCDTPEAGDKIREIVEKVNSI